MPSIIVVADTENDPGHAHPREQVPAAIMVDPRSAGALIERIAFALAAAEQAERAQRTRVSV
jgi:phosphopentomutase